MSILLYILQQAAIASSPKMGNVVVGLLFLVLFSTSCSRCETSPPESNEVGNQVPTTTTPEPSMMDNNIRVISVPARSRCHPEQERRAMVMLQVCRSLHQQSLLSLSSLPSPVPPMSLSLPPISSNPLRKPGPPSSLRSFLPAPTSNPQQQFSSKIRVLTGEGGKPREVRIPTSPFMSVYDALKQAEIKIQYLYPELEGQQVIQVEVDETDNCYRVTRVGKITEDDSFGWIIRVRSPPSQEGAYEGKCVPTKNQVYVRPGTTIDLVLVPKPQPEQPADIMLQDQQQQ